MTEKIKILKYDSVYNKIECDPGIAYELKDYFSFKVPGYKFMPAYRNKVWSGDIYLFNPLTCTLYAGLNEYVESFCKTRKYEFELDGIDYDEEFSLIEAKKSIENMSLTKVPRDYQINAYVHAVRKRRAVLLSPTASGKSLIIYMLTRHYNSNTLIIVPTTSLVHQMASDFEDYGFDPGQIHKIMGGEEKITDKKIVISTWQSIYKLHKNWFDRFDLVIGDECHLFKAKSLTTIMTNLPSCKHRFGFTGTLDGTQTNKMVLEGLFGPVTRVTTTSELMQKGTVASLKIKALVLKYPDHIKKEVSKLDYQKELDFIVTNQSRNKFIKNLVLSLTGNTIVFFNFVDKHGKVLYDMIKDEAGARPVYFISGEVSAHDREQIRHSVETKTDCIILASSGTTSTGVNIVNLQNLVFTSPSKSRIRNLQSIGRVLRKSGDKVSATLYDIADDLSWKSKKNHTILHFLERIKIYSSESFDYKIYPIDLK